VQIEKPSTKILAVLVPGFLGMRCCLSPKKGLTIFVSNRFYNKKRIHRSSVYMDLHLLDSKYQKNSQS
jgi:hypothetical protein